MPEEGAEVPRGPEEIGRIQFDKLSVVLGEREEQGFNVVGWGGDSTALRVSVENHNRLPAVAIAGVGVGVSEYKRTGDLVIDDPNSMRAFADALLSGSGVIPHAQEIDGVKFETQMREFIESNGGVYDGKVDDWQAFVRSQADKIRNKAVAWEVANS